MKVFKLLFVALIIAGMTSCNNVGNDSSIAGNDQRLKKQLTEYNNALFNGDINKVSNYLYPALFEWAELQYENDSEYSKEILLNYFIDEMQYIKIVAEKNNYDFGIELKDITKRISYQNQLIYLLNMELYIQKDDKRQEEVSTIICISEDRGQNWCFIEKDDDNEIGEILLLRFPPEIVEQILSI